jgi:preprotein translocase subunit YajC
MAKELFGATSWLKRAILLMPVMAADALAMGQPAGGEQQGGIAGLFLPLALMFLVLYIFMIRPTQKKQKAKEQMLDALKKGDQIVTSGGILGDVQSVKESTVIVRIADNVKVELQRASVSSVISGDDSGQDA